MKKSRILKEVPVPNDDPDDPTEPLYVNLQVECCQCDQTETYNMSAEDAEVYKRVQPLFQVCSRHKV